jgi:hypothetical protein
VPNPVPREDILAPEETSISDLEVEGFRPTNPLITDLSVPILVQVVPPEVTSPDHHLVRRLDMEVSNATSTGSPHTPIPTMGGGGIVPPPPPSPTRNTSSQTPTTSGSGTVSSMTSTTVHTSTVQNTSGAPFTYGMSGFDTSSTLTYSTLQTIGLGAGSSNAPLQGSLGGTSAPYNAVPYGGGHIPPPSPSLGGDFQQPSGPSASSSLFSGGSQGPQSFMTLVGSMPFSLFGAFGNNTFSSSTFSSGGNPFLNQPNPMQGFVPSQGVMT